jgi:hypothetical protein
VGRDLLIKQASFAALSSEMALSGHSGLGQQCGGVYPRRPSGPAFSPGVHTDSSFARERPQSNRKSFSATPALMGSGSLEPAFVSGVPTIISEKAASTNDTAAFDRGFVWNGKTYPSLSKVAFVITGTRWSGPRFFGLRDKPAKGSST